MEAVEQTRPELNCRKLIYNPTRGMVTRLGVLIPLTPWPVLWRITQEEGYAVGRHGVSALYAVGTLSLMISYGLTAFGALLVWFGDNRDYIRWTTLPLLIMNLVLLEVYIRANAVGYA